MPITETPQLEREFRYTQTLTQEIRSMPKNTLAYSEATCYYLTDISWGKSAFKESIVFTTFDDVPASVDKQLALIYLSANLLKNSQPLQGEALAAMNRTSARLFSKLPTRL